MLSEPNSVIPAKTHNKQLMGNKNLFASNFEFDISNFDCQVTNDMDNDFLNSTLYYDTCCGGGVVDAYNNVLSVKNDVHFGFEQYPQSCVQILNLNTTKHAASNRGMLYKNLGDTEKVSPDIVFIYDRT